MERGRKVGSQVMSRHHAFAGEATASEQKTAEGAPPLGLPAREGESDLKIAPCLKRQTKAGRGLFLRGLSTRGYLFYQEPFPCGGFVSLRASFGGAEGLFYFSLATD